MRTNDLAKIQGLSVQQIRNYEAQGLLPIAERSASGYRQYTQQHLDALAIIRCVITGYGLATARQIMSAIHRDQLEIAFTLIDDYHAQLALARQQLNHIEASLTDLNIGTPPPPFDLVRAVHISEAAHLLNISVSTLRFWEEQGLIQPMRNQYNRYRRYTAQHLQRLHMIKLLRQAQHDYPIIKTTLDQLATQQPHELLAAIKQSRAKLTSKSRQCLSALGQLEHYISKYY